MGEVPLFRGIKGEATDLRGQCCLGRRSASLLARGGRSMYGSSVCAPPVQYVSPRVEQRVRIARDHAI